MSKFDLYQEYIAKSRYARYLPEENRREHFHESVDRYLDFMFTHAAVEDDTLKTELRRAILNLDVMPSMRALMTAGKALERDNTAGYNCSYLPIDDPKAFDEAMYILMCGTGVGFSVERQYIKCLPEIPEKLYDSDTVIIVKDSKEGWSKSLRMLIALLYSGEIPKWDVSKVRPAGTPLKTFGGRASGPEPLEDLFRFVVKTFKHAHGRKLTSIECHDIMCKIGDIVVVGGVRRSAMISLSNLSDDRMRSAKSGSWWEANPQRMLANNSAVYTEKPEVGVFMKEWLSLYESKSGERGLFSRAASKRVAKKSGRRNVEHEFGTNPCSEIILRPYQFCNLTEVVVRSTDTDFELARKVELATILGTLQSTLTHFPYLRKIWQKNTEEERLLGVSFTGIYDNAFLNDWRNPVLPGMLERLRNVAVETNAVWADKLGINPATAITCVKPSGTVSQLVDAASGIHPRHSKYYIRRTRMDNKDPLTQFMMDNGVDWEPDIRKPESTTIFSFPVTAPDGSLTRESVSAIDHLNLWLIYQRHWCEHKPSVTISVTEDEWPAVGAWVWENFDEISGISFLPYDGGSYKQAPYEEVDAATYQKLLDRTPMTIDWTQLIEHQDNVEGSQTLACTAGNCDV
jgi:ribonucleoside-triphosphate reductase